MRARQGIKVNDQSRASDSSKRGREGEKKEKGGGLGTGEGSDGFSHLLVTEVSLTRSLPPSPSSTCLWTAKHASWENWVGGGKLILCACQEVWGSLCVTQNPQLFFMLTHPHIAGVCFASQLDLSHTPFHLSPAFKASVVISSPHPPHWVKVLKGQTGIGT